MNKIGFCFIVNDNINNISIWEKFFEGNLEKANIYIHSTHLDNINQDFVKKYQVNHHIPTKWGNLYDAIKLIYQEAIKNNDYKVVLLSDSTLPLKSFDFIYNLLMSNDDTYMYYQDAFPKTQRQKDTLIKSLKRYINNSNRCSKFAYNIDFRHWFFNETWTILNNKHMKMIYQDTVILEYLQNGFCLDENYPSYLLSINNELSNVHNTKSTYVNWEQREHKGNGMYGPKTYNSVTSNDIELFKNKEYLFGRKFVDNCNISNYIEQLWIIT